MSSPSIWGPVSSWFASAGAEPHRVPLALVVPTAGPGAIVGRGRGDHPRRDVHARGRAPDRRRRPVARVHARAGPRQLGVDSGGVGRRPSGRAVTPAHRRVWRHDVGRHHQRSPARSSTTRSRRCGRAGLSACAPTSMRAGARSRCCRPGYEDALLGLAGPHPRPVGPLDLGPPLHRGSAPLLRPALTPAVRSETTSPTSRPKSPPTTPELTDCANW